MSTFHTVDMTAIEYLDFRVVTKRIIAGYHQFALPISDGDHDVASETEPVSQGRFRKSVCIAATSMRIDGGKVNMVILWWRKSVGQAIQDRPPLSRGGRAVTSRLREHGDHVLGKEARGLHASEARDY